MAAPMCYHLKVPKEETWQQKVVLASLVSNLSLANPKSLAREGPRTQNMEQLREIKRRRSIVVKVLDVNYKS
jgi:hypothetical protein